MRSRKTERGLEGGLSLQKEAIGLFDVSLRVACCGGVATQTTIPEPISGVSRIEKNKIQAVLSLFSRRAVREMLSGCNDRKLNRGGQVAAQPTLNHRKRAPVAAKP